MKAVNGLDVHKDTIQNNKDLTLGLGGQFIMSRDGRPLTFSLQLYFQNKASSLF
jgi:hypothetical protein